ncbi:MAG: hypothetical protein OXF82_03065, partial [Gammaproteobacteria bacterium]|nr:hypothetical protein [Gammaproteobacteria bacterium]
GYFHRDRLATAAAPVFNRTISLRAKFAVVAAGSPTVQANLSEPATAKGRSV